MKGRTLGDQIGTALSLLFGAAVVAAIGMAALAVWGIAVWLR